MAAGSAILLGKRKPAYVMIRNDTNYELTILDS